MLGWHVHVSEKHCHDYVQIQQQHSRTPDPPEECSGIIVYKDLCPGQDPVLANLILQLLYDVSLNLENGINVGLLKGYCWTHCEITLVHSEIRTRMSCTSSTK